MATIAAWWPAYGVGHAVAGSAGTAALHTALVSCGVTAGDEVLLPTATVSRGHAGSSFRELPQLLEIRRRAWDTVAMMDVFTWTGLRFSRQARYGAGQHASVV
ncbi:DegT/DnrJ/EryC1/StrS family aminotransferase [Nonomuraea sp. CA-141351]|uniref:DegT/DnrJ/EryC1/StrS family aminotransferase n=1 Tax=Nonomuraea sp. CA-141351 TaxID=3239996 RepID=UPI003D8DA578